MNIHTRMTSLCALTQFIFLAVLAACSARDKSESLSDISTEPGRTAFVHLFEWNWPSVALECEQFLGPAGYAAVQVSPPQEHAEGPQWWTRYQPVSYRLISRGGTREQFVDMVARCSAVGVDIYVDAVLNHMTGVRSGTGVAGTEYGEYDYPGLYGYDDFNHCDRNNGDDIANFDDVFELHNCELVNLADLATDQPDVRERLAAFLNDLLSVGVAGFRLDAAKHMPAADIAAILAQVDGDPYIFQEIIADDSGPLDRSEYIDNGSLTEFGYAPRLQEAFSGGDLSAIGDLGMDSGLLPTQLAVVFIDNHDTQRGHWGEGLNFTAGDRYALANVFMLAWPYGYPKVMSSYEFDDRDEGSPATDPVTAGADGCNAGWVCEHRWPAVAAMVRFRNATDGLPVTHWQAHGTTAISFGRGSTGHVMINVGDEAADLNVQTDLQPGSYDNLLPGPNVASVVVGDDGQVRIRLEPVSAAAILAD